MPPRLVAIFVLASALRPVAPAAAQKTQVDLVLTNARVLDPSGDRWLDRRTLTIHDGRIARIASAGETKPPDGAKTIDLNGYSIVPGLIDLHTHLLLHPYNEAKWNDQVLKQPLELRVIRAVAAGRATLEAGFTTIRDLGTEGAACADVALRDAFASGLAVGPCVIATTRAIVATGCYGPKGFDPRWHVPQGADEGTGPDELRRIVRRQIADGADWIKFYADYHRRPDAPTTATFSQEEMNAIVDEARSAGLRVAAHATTSEGIRRAVLAGVSTIEHGYTASEEVLKLMKERGVVLCPTLAAAEAYARYEGWKKGDPEPAELRTAKNTFARAVKLGVPIAFGTDAGVFSHGGNARELELMVAGGMSPTAALRAATATAAQVLGDEKNLGRVDEGWIADLVVVRGDPLQDITVFRQPSLVIKAGQVVVDRR